MCENTDSRCTTTATVRGTRLCAGGVSRFLCLSFFAAAKKVSAAPHRGNANRPITLHGKANAVGKQPNPPPQANNSRKGQRHRQTDNQAPRKQKPLPQRPAQKKPSITPRLPHRPILKPLMHPIILIRNPSHLRLKKLSNPPSINRNIIRR